MKAKLGDLLKVWKAYDFMEFPRMMGDPLQTAVYSDREFVKWFRANTGKAICFTSHNSYPELNQQYNPPSVLSVRVSNLFDDFDDKPKPENAQNDTIKAIKFCQKEDLDYANCFSGTKGFHHYIRLIPSVHPYDEELKTKIRAIHNWLKDELKLRTMDGRCRDVRRLCRIPYSKYVTTVKKSGEYIIGNTYCCPLKADDIMDKSIHEIKEYAKSPDLFVPFLSTPKWDLDGFISNFDIDIKEYACDKELEDGERVAISREYNVVPEDDLHDLIKALVPRMCVHNDLFARNPTHPARRMTVTQLKDIGYSFSQVVSLFEEMSEKFHWVDRMFRSKRIYQIKHIYFHLPKYKPDTCGKIKNEHGLCVGEACPKFRGW